MFQRDRENDTLTPKERERTYDSLLSRGVVEALEGAIEGVGLLPPVAAPTANPFLKTREWAQ